MNRKYQEFHNFAPSDIDFEIIFEDELSDFNGKRSDNLQVNRKY